MTRKGDAKFKGKLTCGLKNIVSYLVNFHASCRKSGSLHFNRLLLFKAYNDKEELCFMTLKSDVKFEEKLTLGFKTDMRKLVILMLAVASLKTCILMC